MKKYFLMLFIIFININNSYSYNEKTYIPSQAFEYKTVIWSELAQYFSSIPTYYYIPSLIEHESCISLKHSRCWKPNSELRTKRELGIGLGMITKAYDSNGNIRFDSLKDMHNKYKSELKELAWDTIYIRPDLQIRTMILMVRESYNKLYDVKDNTERLMMTDAAYNGGLGGLNKERRACSLSPNCDPQIWFNNVEKMSVKSTKAIYGDRSPFMINRHHVVDVFHNNLPKYTTYYH